jgi:hypothetical protein
MLLYIIISILIILIIYIYFDQPIKYYDFGNKNSNIKICLIGGTHGNERASVIYLNYLINKKYFESIKKDIYIRVIPCVNKFGFLFNLRYRFHLFNPDINRNYINNGLDNISKQIISLTKDMDLIVDFHEGWGFHKINPSSLGSTITVTNSITDLGQKILSNINSTIKNEKYKFEILYDVCDIKSSLLCYHSNKKFILVETSGQNNIQPLVIRTKQIQIILDTIFNNI